MKHIFTYFFTVIFSLVSAGVFAQVTVTSSDTLSCVTTCTTLTGHLIGDLPYDPGIRLDDEWSPIVIPIGFTFNFYGNNYTKCLMGDNGNITFDTTLAGGYDPWEIDGALASPTLTSAGDDAYLNNTIDGPWSDVWIVPAGSGSITYSTDGVAPNRKFVVTWCHCQMYDTTSCPGQSLTTQIIIYETSNIIEVHISHKTICTLWNSGRGIVGVRNSTGTVVTVAPARDYTPSWATTDEGWRFTPYMDTTAVLYSVASIPYAPIPYASSALYWYNATTGAFIDTGLSITVCPGVPTTYRAGALGCGDTATGSSADTSFGYYTVTPTPTLVASIAVFTNPSLCGECNGIIVVNGLTPGTIDTLNYEFAGVAQPTFIGMASTGGTMTLTGLCAGAYTNIIAKQGTCVSSPLSVTLVNPAISISGLTSANVTTCPGSDGSIVLHGLYPGYAFTVNYTLNGLVQPPVLATSDSFGTITLSGLTIGAYANIIASFSTACATAPAGPDTLTGPPPPFINLVSSTNPTQCGYCDGSMTIQYVSAYASDTVFYSFNGVAQPPFLNIAGPDGSVHIPGLCAGIYTDMTVKVGSCPSTVLGSAVLVSPPIIDSFGYTNHFGCNGDTVMFKNTSSAPGALYYVWNFGDGATDTNANPMHIYAQGTYTITLTADNNVCDTTFSLTDTLLHPLSASFVDTPFIYCQNMPVTLTNTSDSVNTGAIAYKWLFGDGGTDTAFNTMHTYAQAGVYDVQLVATNFVPCSDTASLTVDIDSSSAIGLVVTDSVLCRSSSVTFTATYSNIGNTGITWQFGDGDSISNINPVTHSFDGTGTFTVTATANYRKCDDTSVSKKFNVYPAPGINLGPDTSICAGSAPLVLSDAVNAATEGATWLWSTGQTTSSIIVTTPGYYAATVDINGCYATDTVWVSNDCYMDIPNVFTPNGDGINDYFYPMQMLSMGVVSYSMDIYNRWGQLLFHATALDGRGWDGKFNSVDQPEGVYVYTIDAVFKDGQKEHHQGNVTLLR